MDGTTWQLALRDFAYYVGTALLVAVGWQLWMYLRAKVHEMRAYLPDWIVDTLSIVARLGVTAAEQMKRAYGYDNDAALTYALDIVGQLLASRGMSFPEDVVRAAIEAEINRMHMND